MAHRSGDLPVATRWASPPSWPELERETSSPSGDLLALVEGSLRRGHRRVALQRALMLHAAGGALPRPMNDLLRSVWRQLPKAEQRRMISAADAWVAMVARRPLCVQPSGFYLALKREAQGLDRSEGEVRSGSEVAMR